MRFAGRRLSCKRLWTIVALPQLTIMLTQDVSPSIVRSTIGLATNSARISNTIVGVHVFVQVPFRFEGFAIANATMKSPYVARVGSPCKSVICRWLVAVALGYRRFVNFNV